MFGFEVDRPRSQSYRTPQNGYCPRGTSGAPRTLQRFDGRRQVDAETRTLFAERQIAGSRIAVASFDIETHGARRIDVMNRRSWPTGVERDHFRHRKSPR